MTDGPIQIDPVKANPYMLLEPDELGVLGSTRWVVEQAKHVQINRDHVRDACATFLKRYSPATETTWYERFHFYDGTERTVNWLLVLDALNFCFWAEKGQPRWRIDYHGEILDGYWAEAAALTGAVEEGIALWDAGYLSTMSREDLAYIFRGVQSADGAAEEMIPLFEQRLEHVHEVGRVLLERYDGQFAHAVKQAEGSAVKLTQVLRHYGLLEYQHSLAERVDKQELLAAGGEAEVELRAATIWACELLRREMSDVAGRVITAVEIDQLLWYLGQNASDMRPYHRTRTIYY